MRVPPGRCLDKASLAEALQDSRRRTLSLAADYVHALGPGLQVPLSEELNPPLWELGHIGWFADWWITRHPQHHAGVQADPQAVRRPARQAARGVDADALYNSSTVPHAARWRLPLPALDDTLADLQASLDDTLSWLERAEATDQGLYFFRLALFHEDMHAEAAVHMAQTLDIPIGPHTFSSTHTPETTDTADGLELVIDASEVLLGWAGDGFAFDNERGAHRVGLPAFRIDAAPVTWARFLPFVDDGGYHDARWWSATGWDWRCRTGISHPRYLEHRDGQWAQRRWGRWQPLQLRDPAVHLSAHEAEAWCRWAGRRLPTEAEWTAAAHQRGWQGMTVWEWTASRFEPFPGFEPHPYRDYSAPWFDGRPVLKGASPATALRMQQRAYRNFYTADRNDILAGFRSAAC